MPRLGGIAIVLGFTLAVFGSLVLPIDRPADEWPRIWGFLLGGTVVVLLGIWDDLRHLSPFPQLLLQVVAAAIVVTALGPVGVVNSPFGEPIMLHPLVGYAFALVWILGFVNTVNWLDGIDGLAAGVVAIAGLVLFVRSVGLEQYSIALLALALVGSALGFLPFNFYPARLFMGSSGAYFLGYALGVLSIIGGAKVATALLVLGIPIIDAAWDIALRIALGASPFIGDRSHLHHRLLSLGLSPRQIVLLLYALCGVFGVLALVLSETTQRLYALVGLVVIAGALVIGASQIRLSR